ALGSNTTTLTGFRANSLALTKLAVAMIWACSSDMAILSSSILIQFGTMITESTVAQEPGSTQPTRTVNTHPMSL
ncbi:uncharacterized protein METZ01_LOCUS130382, partial [marine metagenome]